MQILILYFATALVFLGLDVIGLRLLIRPVFERHVGDLLVDGFRLVPALVFYLFYVAGLIWFVSLPALRAEAPAQAALGGAFLGALAYGTYEFTNLATLKGWSWSMLLTDLSWGIFLTGFAAWAGLMITRALS
ncbi:MAG: DUF2177 family protein [Marinovum algicola]|jgi:uncharacterized membrane protein|uniref:Uncharacterized membrane protein n=1 Tax=Marinovum algicola TaxID=42444 RepID=A0A975W9D9_9RHOB|nr:MULTISPECIES: DUF2177 family protein [Marinovum]MDD9741963.1 DUF2177 family protein [Marinovum sp. SP66]MDD9745054.1 DUF2177 family protein [Marinovum sp. PR37]SEJ34590.1 Uncharacterized membrane protein [Marinovum algicola]SLN38504.1 hypothetical protein MAA5396_01805 [Marinovum algicola]